KAGRIDDFKQKPLLYRRPRTVRVEELKLPGNLERGWAKILFIDDAVVTNHESLDPSDAILRRRRDEREATDHHTLDHKIQLTKRSRGALTLQNLKVVSVVRVVCRVALLNRPADFL